jgi:seryl-tRNA synthetase
VILSDYRWAKQLKISFACVEMEAGVFEGVLGFEAAKILSLEVLLP